MATLIKTDKNGTKYWYDENCPKCGGVPIYVKGEQRRYSISRQKRAIAEDLLS